MKKRLPLIGQRIKFKDKNPNKKGYRVLEGTVVDVSTKLGTLVYVGNITSHDEFVIRLESIIK